jgi:hypothetical protein
MPPPWSVASWALDTLGDSDATRTSATAHAHRTDEPHQDCVPPNTHSQSVMGGAH